MARKDNGAGAATLDPIQELINNAPPLEDDPDSFWGDEEREDQDLSEEETQESGDTETTEEEGSEPEGRARDAQGRFARKDEDKSASSPPAAPAEPVDPYRAYLDSIPEAQRPDVEQSLDFAKAMRESQNPVQFLAQAALSANLRDQMLRELGLSDEIIATLNNPQTQAGIDEEYEPVGYEVALRPHINKLADFDNSVGKIADERALRVVQQQFNDLAPHLDYSNVETQILSETLHAVVDALGIAIPPVDQKAVMDRVYGKDRPTYRDAVRAVIGDTFKKAVEDYRQAVKVRPETPGDSSPTISNDDLPRDRAQYGVPDMRDIWRNNFGRSRQ
jgi:hypothetical protein